MVIESLNDIKSNTKRTEVTESKDYKHSARLSSKSDIAPKRFNKRNLEDALNSRKKCALVGGVTYIGDKFFTLDGDTSRDILHKGSVKYMTWRSSKTAVSIVNQCCFKLDIKPISTFKHKLYLVRDKFGNIWFSTRDVKRVGVVKIDSTLGISFFFTQVGWFYFSSSISTITGLHSYSHEQFNLDYEFISSEDEMDNLISLFKLFGSTGCSIGSVKEVNTIKWRCKNDRNVKRNIPTEKFLQPESNIMTFLDRCKGFVDGASFVESKINSTMSAIQTPPDGVLETIMVHIERFFAFVTGVGSTSSIAGAASVAYLYVGTLGFQRSISLWAGKLLADKLTEINEGLQPQSTYDDFKSIFSDFKLMKNSQIFRNIVKIFESLLLLQIIPDSFISLCDKSGIMKVAGIDITTINKSSSGSMDILEILIESVLFVTDKVSTAILSGNITSLFIDDSRIFTLDAEYVHVIACKDYLDNEDFLINYDAAPPFGTANGYLTRLEELVKSYEELAKVESKSKFTQTYINVSRKLVLLAQIAIQAREDIKRKPLREQPFSILISGSSGIGKTTIYGGIIDHICKCNGISCKPRDRVTLNEADKFQSEVKVGTSVIIMDDLCNGSPQSYKTGSPLGNVIKIINNVPCAAVKASVHEKGQVYFNNKLTIATTNCPDLQSPLWSIEPASVLRRFHYHIHTKLLPDYATKQHTVDSSKLIHGIYTPAWEFSVKTVQSIPGSYQFIDEFVTKDPYILMEFLMLESKKHYRSQKQYVESMRDMSNDEMCEHSFYASLCRKCKSAKPKATFLPEGLIDNFKGFCTDVKRTLFPQISDEECDIRRAELRHAVSIAQGKLDRSHLILNSFSREYHSAINAIMVRRCNEYLELSWTIADMEPGNIRNELKREWLCNSDISGWQESVFTEAFDYVKAELNLLDDEKNALFTACVREFSLGRSLAALYYRSDSIDDSDSMWEEVTVDEYLDDYMNYWGWSFNKWKIATIETFWIKFGGKSLYESISKTFSLRHVIAAGIAAKIAISATAKAIRMVSPYLRKFLDMWRTPNDFNPQRGEEDIDEGVITPRLLPTDGGHKSLVLEDIPRSVQSHSSTSTQFRMKLNRSLATLQVLYYVGSEAKASSMNAFPLFGTLWLVPNHSFNIDIEYTGIILRTRGDGQIGKMTTEPYDEINLLRLPKYDLAILNIPSFGTVPSMVNYIAPKRVMASKRGIMYTKTLDGELLRADVERIVAINNICGGKSEDDKKKVTYAQQYDGVMYKVHGGTTRGYCMSPVVDEGGTSILAFHLSGEKYKKPITEGAGVYIDPNELKSIAHSHFPETALISGQDSLPVPYGKTLVTESDIHLRHALRKLDVDTCVHVDYMGSHGQLTTFKTQYREHPKADIVCATLGLSRSHYPPTHEFMKSEGITVSDIWKKDLTAISEVKGGFDPLPFASAYGNLLSTYITAWSEADLILRQDTHPYTELMIVNNRDGLNGLTRIDLKTSGGPHLPGPKLKHAIQLESSPYVSHNFTFTEKIWDEVRKLDKKLRNGERINTIFKACIKDEALKKGKGKMRVFGGCDLAFTCVVRKYFSPIVRFMYNRWLTCELAVGINTFGPDWDHLATHLLKYPRFLAGDYKNYDKTMSPILIQRSIEIMIMIANVAGYSSQDIRAMRTIAMEIAFPIYDYDGSYIQVAGSNPSGNPLTVIVNCIANQLLHRYAFYTLYPKYVFTDHIVLTTYGDDCLCSVSADVPLFNYQNVQSVFAKSRIVWTDAHKSIDLTNKRYDCIEEVSFLKRSFRQHTLLKRWVGVLEFSSLAKMFSTYRATSNLHDEHPDVVLRQNLSTFIRERFLELEDNIVDVINLTRTIVIGDNNFVPDDSIASAQALTVLFDKFHARNFAPGVYDLSDGDVASNTCDYLFAESDLIYGSLPRSRWRLTNDSIEKSSGPSFLEVEGRADTYDLTTTNNKQPSTVSSTRATQCVIELQPESEMTSFVDAGGNMLDMGSRMDITASASVDNLSLENFLKRPVRIGTFRWPLNGDVNLRFYPWWLYLTIPSVLEKIRGFRHIRGNMHIKFVINGSAFHYGRLMAYYRPLTNEYTTPVSNNANRVVDIMQWSQHKHILLNPCGSEGGEMILPFFNFVDSLELAYVSDVVNMGSLYVASVAPLRTAGGQLQNLTVSIYAWMENVELYTPTISAPFSFGTPPVVNPGGTSPFSIPVAAPVVTTNLVPQSDEYTGPISQPASVVAKIAGKLEHAPVIGDYAKATNIAAGATAMIAKSYGYSRPIDLKQPSKHRLVPTGSLATMNTVDTSEKLSMDVKQELTIDARTVGLQNEDDLSIKSIGSRMTMIDNFSWSHTAVERSRLWFMPITPMIFRSLVYTDRLARVGRKIVTTPQSYISQFFKYWRGEVCFNFDIVHCGFHSGRIRIVVDPGTSSTTFPAENDNKVMSWVLDISEASNICVPCPWMTNQNYLRCHATDEGASFPTVSSLPLPAFNRNTHVGTISVYVENLLSVPDEVISPAITVIVSTKINDFELAVPRDTDTIELLPESELLTIAEDVEVSHDVGIKSNYRTTVFFGEEITSMRQVMKRYQKADHLRLGTKDTAQTTPVHLYHSAVYPSIPLPRYAANYNQYFPNTFMPISPTVISMIIKCFVGWRGAMRWKYMHYPLSRSTMYSAIPSTGEFSRGRISDLGPDPKSFLHDQSGLAGSALMMGNMGALEIESPYYSIQRMSNAQRVDYTLGVDGWFGLRTDPFVRLSVHSTIEPGPSDRSYVTRLCAIGEDFQVFYFLCTPNLFTLS